MKSGTETVSSVLFINRVYPPDTGATGQLLAELATGMAAIGIKVTVVTSKSTAESLKREIIDDVAVERVGGVSVSRSNHWRRALAYLSLYPLLMWRVMCLPRHGVIVTMTDPPMQLLLGPVLGWFRKARLVHWAQDVYPELAEELGVIKKNGVLATLLRALATWALQQHDAVICIGQCMKHRMIERGIEEKCVHVIPNWADVKMIRPSQENFFSEKHGLNGQQIVMYSGNMGLAHPFEAVLDAAENLAVTHSNGRFVFIGDGPKQGWLARKARARQLENLVFLPFQDKNSLSGSLGAADIHLACMDESLLGLMVPSKVYGIMAAGKPCIFIGPKDCEAAKLIQEHQCGAVVPQQDGRRIAAIIRHWLTEDDSRKQAGRNARKAAEEFCLNHAVKAFVKISIRRNWS
ncbi:MAG: glycosyltransferase family 4 protein [Mariprofundaceae bacterium]